MKSKANHYLRIIILTFLVIPISISTSQGQIMKKIIGGAEDLINKGRDEINNVQDKNRSSNIHNYIAASDLMRATEELTKYVEKFGHTANYHFLEYKFNLQFYPTVRSRLDTALYHLKRGYSMERTYQLCEKIGFCQNMLEQKKDSLERKIYFLVRSNDTELTWFLERFKDSKWYSDAFAYQTDQRFKAAKKTNTVDAYEQFIYRNSKAKEIGEALYLQGNLAYQAVENSTSPQDFQLFINRYPNADKSLQIKAKNKIRMIEFNNLQNEIISTKEKYREVLSKFTSSDRGSYSLSINLSKNPIELSSIEVSEGNLKFRAFETYREIFKNIDKFIGRYPNSPETAMLNQQKNLIIENCREVDFIALSKSGREFFKDDDDIASAKNWEWYTKFHSKSVYNAIAKAKLDRTTEIARKIQEEEQRKQDIIRENERKAAELAEQKKKEELNEDFSPFTQALKLLSPADRAYYSRVVNMNNDPQGRIGNSCGVGMGRCEWCGRSIKYQKSLESRIRTLQLLSNPLMGGFANIMLGFANILGQAFGGKKTNLPLKLKNDLVNEMRLIRAGKIYFCSGSSPKFCSPKCEADQQFHKKYRR